MLAEITGIMQITTCVLIIGATGVWLGVLNLCKKNMNLKFRECMDHEKRIIALEYEVAKLTKIAKFTRFSNVNQHLEEVRGSLADLHRKE